MAEKPIGELIEPMPGMIAVSIDTKGEWTPQGLLIPLESARSIHEAKPTFGTIVAVGYEYADDEDDEEDEEVGLPVATPLSLKIGDVVLFSKFSGTRISRTIQYDAGEGKVGRREEAILLMRRTDVLARVKDSDSKVNLKVR